MTKTLEIEDALVDAARAVTGETDDRAAVERILKGALAIRRKNAALLDLVGKVEFYEGYDPKALSPVRHDPG
ncbi:MAG: hypothetical protein U1E20_09325 [Methylocystis sp.]|uniref:hypothetical protein n=1 Tax=Methylocystis sp. TaxID=1911079 RepID=UPI0039295B05